MSIKTAAIIGGGIAGLTAALALARHGIHSDIIEQAERLTEVGAGLQISPNAARILDSLGVLGALETVWLEPRQIGLSSGITLKPITAVPSGAFARSRWGAPYGVLHRATLQRALLQAVLANPLCRLHLGQRLDPADRASIAAFCGTPPELVIGADGVWSKARALVEASPVAQFSGNVAWRLVVPDADIPAFFDQTSVTAFLGPMSHLVCYPLRDVGGFNIVAITSGADPGPTWQAAGDITRRALLLQRFAGWNPLLHKVLENALHPTFWPLYQAGNGRWHNGRDTILIGDAAHAMMPFAAQGAAMAIEDASEIARLVATRPLAEALPAFESLRKPRIARLRQRAAFNKFAYHARGPVRLGRDFVLSMRAPEALAADFDWIYGYAAEG